MKPYEKRELERKESEITLCANLKSQKDELAKIVAEVSDEWGYEDHVYRFYHQSFKVFRLQEATTKITQALMGLVPGRPLNPWYLKIFGEGTGKVFDQRTTNANWLGETRPIVEAFFHARFFLEMAIRYSGQEPVNILPSGWAALLSLYDLR